MPSDANDLMAQGHLQVKTHGVPFPDADPTGPRDVVGLCRGIGPIDTRGKGDAGRLGEVGDRRFPR